MGAGTFGLTGLSAGQLRKRTAPSERCVLTFPAWGCSPALVPVATLSCLDNERGLLFTVCSSARSAGLPVLLQGLKSSLGTVQNTQPIYSFKCAQEDLI